MSNFVIYLNNFCLIYLQIENMIYIRKILLLILLTFCLSLEYPDFEVIINDEPFSSDMFISTKFSNNYFLAVIDPNLNIKWYITDISGKGLDFKVNKNVITYFQKSLNNDFTDRWLAMNSNMMEIDTLYCENGYTADWHDIYFLENGGYFLQAYSQEELDISETIGIDIANILILQEFDANKNLLFEWKNSDHMNIQDYSTEFNLSAPRLNWMHGNSIEIDYDNNVIVSNRAMSEIIKFNRYNGEIIWILGGPMNDFTFINDVHMGPNLQHDARRLNNGNLLIFDNATDQSRPSRVIEYEIDENLLTANLVWEFSHPEEFKSLNQGSSQRLENGNTLISWGTVINSDPNINSNTLGAIITEVDQNKEIKLEIRYPIQNNSYKVRKEDWEFSVNLIIGDINLDSIVNILDLISSINLILEIENYEPFHLFKTDINRDGDIDILDIVNLVNIILQQT